MDLDSSINGEMERLGIPGLSIAALTDDAVTFEKSYGSAERETGVEASSDTVYPIGSLSKQFTAAAVLILLQDGKVDLDVDLTDAVPDLTFPETWKNVTVRHLLNQTSGITNFMAKIGLNPFIRLHHFEYSAQHVVDTLNRTPVLFEPGERYHYSNTNYFLLSEVVRAASGLTYDEFLQNRIFRPLGMTSTKSLDPFTFRHPQAARYSRIGIFRLKNRINVHPSLYIGSGGLESSLTDMIKWNIALNSEFPLTDSTKELMWTAPVLPHPGPTQYGFGWVIDSSSPNGLVWHNGMIPAGAKCWMGRYRKTGQSIIALSNYSDMANPQYTKEFATLCRTVAENV